MKNLTKAEEQVMQALWKLEKGFLKDIVETMPDPKPHPNTVEKKLVKRTQSKEDKRETMMSLTEKSLTLLESSLQHMNETFENILRLSNEEAKALNDLLEKVNK